MRGPVGPPVLLEAFKVEVRDGRSVITGNEGLWTTSAITSRSEGKIRESETERD